MRQQALAPFEICHLLEKLVSQPNFRIVREVPDDVDDVVDFDISIQDQRLKSDDRCLLGIRISPYLLVHRVEGKRHVQRDKASGFFSRDGVWVHRCVTNYTDAIHQFTDYYRCNIVG